MWVKYGYVYVVPVHVCLNLCSQFCFWQIWNICYALSVFSSERTCHPLEANIWSTYADKKINNTMIRRNMHKNDTRTRVYSLFQWYECIFYILLLLLFYSRKLQWALLLILNHNFRNTTNRNNIHFIFFDLTQKVQIDVRPLSLVSGFFHWFRWRHGCLTTPAE